MKTDEDATNSAAIALDTSSGPMSATPMLEIAGLYTQFDTRDGTVRAVDGVDLAVPAGKTVCVVGESGCGKSITARSVLGLIDPPGRVTAGEVWWNSATGERIDLASLDPKGERMRHIRGEEIAMVFQEPMASLSPMYTVGAQLSEMLRLHRGMDKAQARVESISLLERVGIPIPEARFDAYSWQLSGGMCQRVMIAMALSCGPSLLIADEPTTALDVTIQARILDLFAELQRETGMSVLFITHDLGVVAEIADEVAVMYLGRVVERGTVEEIFADPKHPYTRALLGSVPRMGAGTRQRLTMVRGQVPHGARRPAGCGYHPRCDHAVEGLCDVTDPSTATPSGGHDVQCVLYDASLVPDGATRLPMVGPRGEAAGGVGPDADKHVGKDAIATTDVVEPALPNLSEATERVALGAPMLEVRDLRVHFPVKKGFFGRTAGHVHAVDGVSLTIRAGETLGLVGESGCGKTTLGRSIVRSETPTSGEIRYRGGDGSEVDLAQLSAPGLRPYQRQVRLVFQDPFSSLNPRMTLRQIIGEPLITHNIARGSELTDRVAEMLQKVGLSPDYMDRYPHAFSGGQRQRVNIARALILEPRLVVADEAVSALDVSVRAQILNLLRDLQDEYDLTYLFISHDLSVVESICDRVAVMYLGKIVELAETADVYNEPQHPYTEALLSAVPRPDPSLRDADRRIRLADDLPDPSDPPPGCRFHTRCHYAQVGLCDQSVNPPMLRTTESDQNTSGHQVACLRTAELELTGINR
jgi:peptide/nickel transport system ATP-binding protein